MALNSTHFFDVYTIIPKSNRVAHPDSGIYAGGNTDYNHHTAISPVSVPGVGNEPVGSPLLSAPAEDPDSMTSQHLATSVLVHT